MNFKRVNNITGWVVCLIACTVYILTAEAGGSLWDCGEFVSSCFKVQVPHPPGAPLFVLLGRFFIVLFGDNPMTAAKAVNIMSALASGFTILFLFWSVTHFARRIVQKAGETLSNWQIISVMGAGVVGALAYTFSDSFWYSAVEGEVYALSSLFTALVFWAMLKWEHEADQPGADRWIVFIFFMMGLSIGVHLLGLLTIPAIVMVYYFRKRPTFNYALMRKYFIRVLLIGGALAFIAAYLAGRAENNLLDSYAQNIQQQYGEDTVLNDNTVPGLMILGTLIAIGLLYGIEALKKDRKEYYGGAYIFFVIACVITGVVQVGVIQMSIKAAGYFDIFFVNNVGMPFFSGFIIFFLLVAVGVWAGLRFAAKKGWEYMRLGLWCLTFMLIGYSTYITTMIRSNADPAVDMFNVDNPMSLVGYLGRDQYGDFPILYGQKFTADIVQYLETSTKYQKGKEGGKDKYIESGKDGHYVYLPKDKMVFPRMWDASNDQNHADYYALYANINKMKDGTYDRSPDFGDNVKYFIGYQNYFMYLRYFLWNFAGKQDDLEGLFIGNKRDGNWITGISFIDNMIYGDQSKLPDSLKNNKAHNTLFALPLILGLIGMFYHFKRRGDDAFITLLLFFFTGFAIVIYLNQPGFQPRERDYAYVGSFYAFAIWIGLGVLQLQEWLGKKINQSTAAIAATVICLLAVPVLMAQQEWNDHDRSHKQIARDVAKDYLESCAPNAILFTFGDNDTYPLWYAQEVEGIRPDIRVINTSLLGIDWYINQFRYKVNQSNPIDVIWSADQIEGRKRDIAVYRASPGFAEDQYTDLYKMMKDYTGNDANVDNRGYFIYPSKKVSIPVDAGVVRSNGTVNKSDSIVNAVNFEIPKNALYKGDLAMLNIIAANKWQRPIYFTMPYGELGFGDYIRRDGLSYRLVPVTDSKVNTDWMLDKVMNKFGFGNANIFGVYYDEENRRHLNIIRRADAELALDLSSKNRKEDARKVLDRTDNMMLQTNFPYGMVSRNNEHNRISLMFLEACYRSEDKALVAKVSKSIRTDLQQQVKYYNSLTGQDAENMAYDLQQAQNLLQTMDQMEKAYNGKQPAVPESGAIGNDSGLINDPGDAGE